MKTDNDYLAEYVREKRPEIEQSLSFFYWKLNAKLCDVVSAMAEEIKKMADRLSQIYAGTSTGEIYIDDMPDEDERRRLHKE